MVRADEIVRGVLKGNRTSYSYLTLCGSNFFYEWPDKALASSDFPLAVVSKVAQSGRALALSTFEQVNRVPVQIDIYYPQNDYETVSATKYYGYHLLKHIATDVFNCMRTYLKNTSGVLHYTELGDMRMPIEEFNGTPLCRKTLEVELTLKNAD